MKHTVMGYNSKEKGLIWYPQNEWYRTEVLCNNSIVRTENGAAILNYYNEDDYFFMPLFNDGIDLELESELERHYAYEQQGTGRI